MTAQMQIAELNRRLLAGEEVTDEEIIEGIQLLRADRAEKTKVKKQAAVAKEKEATAGEDILNNLI